ncbi:MAG: hypothetical protein ACR2IF_12900 [Terriglobales bacterium]
MKRWALLITLLTVSLWAVAQTSSSGSAGGARTAGSAATSTAAGTSGAAQTPTNGTTSAMQTPTNGTSSGMQAPTNGTSGTAPTATNGGTQPITGTFTGGNAGFTTMPANNGQVSNGGAVATNGVSVVNGLSTSTGTAFISGSPLPPLMVTPEVHLSTVAPSAGATNATPGNIAGAINSTLAMPQPPTIVTTVPEVSSAPANMFMTPAPQQVPGASTLTYATPGAGATGPYNTGVGIMVPGGATVSYVDRGVGSGAATVAGDTGGLSLDEMARDSRQHGAQNARVYTNSDIQRINQQPGVTVGGMTGAAMGAGNSGVPQPSNNMPVVSQPAGSTMPSNPGVSTPVPPSSNPPEQSSIASPTSNEPVQMAQARPPAGQESAGQPAQQGSSRRGRQLPSSGSVLPLMAVVGFAAAAAGLLSH